MKRLVLCVLAIASASALLVAPAQAAVVASPDMSCWIDPGNGPDDVYIGSGKYGVTDRTYWLCDQTPTAMIVWSRMQFSNSPYGPWTWVGTRPWRDLPKSGGYQDPWMYYCNDGYYRTSIFGSFTKGGSTGKDQAFSKVYYINCRD